MKIKYIMYTVPSKRRCTPERTSCTYLTVSDVMAVNSAVLNVGPACLFERSWKNVIKRFLRLDKDMKNNLQFR